MGGRYLGEVGIKSSNAQEMSIMDSAMNKVSMHLIWMRRITWCLTNFHLMFDRTQEPHHHFAFVDDAGVVGTDVDELVGENVEKLKHRGVIVGI